MQLDQYFSENQGKLTFSRQQASDFAKQVADDFNPIHDVDAKRFCVPGDLLFSIALSRIGLSQKMHVSFADMVTDGVDLNFPTDGDKLAITDTNDKTYLTIERSGDNSQNAELISALTRCYVEFSGQTFPHILVPLWKGKDVMINPARPLVIYESMSIDLDTLEISQPGLELSDETCLDVDGKRGNVRLAFNLLDGDKVVGRGEKRMVLSGLRAYDQTAIDDLVEFYNDRKQNA
ncbi:DUF3581 domain-containing protein [Maricurvus nonylphenolicus]|uniref:DUF3581 domain-containing protein n=1 Tax=Maricurvus nonylphenolicus TaxID=1008307 RepID=UPI0036F3AB34